MGGKTRRRMQLLGGHLLTRQALRPIHLEVRQHQPGHFNSACGCVSIIGQVWRREHASGSTDVQLIVRYYQFLPANQLPPFCLDKVTSIGYCSLVGNIHIVPI